MSLGSKRFPERLRQLALLLTFPHQVRPMSCKDPESLVRLKDRCNSADASERHGRSDDNVLFPIRDVKQQGSDPFYKSR